MSRKCIYSDGKGNMVTMAARKTYFKKLTTTSQKTTSTILRDPPPVKPGQIKTVELTTIGIAGAAITSFLLLALLLATVLHRGRKSLRRPVDTNVDHVYDEIGKQGHLRSCFPLTTKKKVAKPRSSQIRPALHPRRMAETNIYDSIEGYGQFKVKQPPKIVQDSDNLDSTVEMKKFIVEQNKPPNTYFELQSDAVIESDCHKGNAHPYFELENENIECRDNTQPCYFQLEMDVPNPYFELENEMEETSVSSRRRCSCGNRPNVSDHYARANLYRPYSVPRMHHALFHHNKRTIDPDLLSNNADVSWYDREQDRHCHTNPDELASVESDIKERIDEASDNNQYFVLEREAHDILPHMDKPVRVGNKDVKDVSTSFPVEQGADKMAEDLNRRRLVFNEGDYSHLHRHPRWDRNKPLSRLVSVDLLERLYGEGGATVIILPPKMDLDSTEHHYDKIHLSPVIKPRSRLNSAPH